MLRNWLVPPQVHLLARIAQGREHRSSYMRVLREVISWTVPVELQSMALSTAYAVSGFEVGKNLELKDRHRAARRCFVIGNGPSLKDTDLGPLRNEITIGANSFYKHAQAELMDLKYLCIGDASFMEDSDKCLAWHRTIEQRLPRTQLMLNPAARKLIEKYALYRNHRVYHYYHGVSVTNSDAAHFDFLKPLNVGHTTGSRIAIPLAIYMGCSEIVLLGFDANWLEDYHGSHHFYERHELFPEFDSAQADKRWPRYEDQLINALRDFEGHRLVAESAARVGVKILNATKGGLLDMYPRVRYEDYLKSAGIVA